MARKHIEICVCDRCKKEFSDSPLEQASWVKPTLVYMKMFAFVRKKERMFSREINPYDLCKECAESFVDWFYEGKQDNA